ncbi:MAG: hypothetical protein IJJ41_01845 [Clostridia bacterium]|nr:hypothetical protein [Clostridia bacterium]
MKRIISLLLVAALVFGVFGCSGFSAVAAQNTATKLTISRTSVTTYLSFEKMMYGKGTGIAVRLIFPKNSDQYDWNDYVQVVSSNPKVVKNHLYRMSDLVMDYPTKTNILTFPCQFDVVGMGSCTLLFKTRGGLTAKCSVYVNQTYCIGVVGTVYSYATINGLNYSYWKASKNSGIIAAKSKYKCTRSSTKGVCLARKVNGRTYVMRILPKTYQECFNFVYRKAFANASNMIGKGQIYFQKHNSPNYYQTSCHYYAKSAEFKPTGYGLMWSSSILYYSPKGLIYLDGAGGLERIVKKSEVGKPCTPSFGA